MRRLSAADRLLARECRENGQSRGEIRRGRSVERRKSPCRSGRNATGRPYGLARSPADTDGIGS